MRRRILSAGLAAALCLSLLPTPAWAAGPDPGLCVHHPEHTDGCGYSGPTQGTPCTHVCTEECYTETTACVHEHDESCYSLPAGDADPDAPVQDEGGGEAVPAGDDGNSEALPAEDGEINALPAGDAERRPDACAHECTEESGCITRSLDCTHAHDEACGYVAPTGGRPCTYDCHICPVQALIDALPDGDTITAENAPEVEAQLAAIDEARMELIDEELDELDTRRYETAVSALLALEDMAGAEEPMALADGVTVGAFTVTGGALDTDYEYDNVSKLLRILTGTPLTIKNTAPAATEDHIVVAENISANVTLAGVNIEVSSSSSAFLIYPGSTGDVTVTLAEGTENFLTGAKGCAGLQKEGDTAAGTLTIQGAGSLIAKGGQGAAGIGGGSSGGSANITIAGGRVTATSGVGGAGIGGDSSGAGANIRITGGTVTATSIDGGAGIGGGNGGAGTVTIEGGTVTATGAGNGAGIGGSAAAGTVTISGGTVTATGSLNGAGIGGGRGGSGTVTISGGNVTASSKSGAGIGNGYEGSDGTFSTGTNGSAWIVAKGGTSVAAITDTSSQSSWSGVIFQNGAGQVYGSDYTLTEGESREIPSGATLTVPAETGLVVRGALAVNGTIANSGWLTIGGDGTLTGTGPLTGEGSFQTNTVTEDMISVPEGLIYNGADRTAEIQSAAKLLILGREFTPSGWIGPTVEKSAASDLEYTVAYKPDTGIGGTATKTVKLAQSGTEFTAKLADGKTEYEYGDTITITGTVRPTGTAAPAMLMANAAPTGGQVAAYANINGTETQVGDAVTPTAGENGVLSYELAVATGDLGAGEHTLTVKYIKSAVMAQAALTLTVLNVAECPHTSMNTDGKCTLCGETIVASVQETTGDPSSPGGPTTYYTDFAEAWNAAQGKTAEIMLLADASVDRALQASSFGGDKPETNITLKAEGNATLTSSSEYNPLFEIGEGGTVMFLNGNYKAAERGNECIAVSGGTVNIKGGTFAGGANAALKVNEGTVQLSGGAFSTGAWSSGAISLEYSDLTLNDLLANDEGHTYGYKTTTDTATGWVCGDDLEGKQTLSQTSVTVLLVPVKITGQPSSPTEALTYGYPDVPSFTVTAQATDPTQPISYQWYMDGTKVTGVTDATYSPVGLAAGEHQFYCAATCDGYTVNSETVTVTVNPAPLTITGATLKEKIYDKRPNATVTGVTFDKATLVLNTDYTASANYDDANAGENKTATVTVTLENGNYTFADGSSTASYTLAGQTIQPRALSSFQVTLEQESYVWTGKQITPAIASARGGYPNDFQSTSWVTLRSGENYDVTYGTNIDVGENAGAVTLTGKGNYSFTHTVNFTITCPHPAMGADGKCTLCQADIAATVAVGADTTYYTDITSAWSCAQGKTATVKLLKDAEVKVDGGLAVPIGTDITLEMAEGVSLNGIKNVTVSVNGSFTFRSGTITNTGDYGGAISLSSGDHGVHSPSFTMTGGTVQGISASSAFNASISGGTITKPSVDPPITTEYSGMTVGGLLAPGYGYRKTDGSGWVTGDALDGKSVNSEVEVKPVPVKITKQPANTTATYGDSASLSIEAEPAEAGKELAYQWLDKDGNAIDGVTDATSATYSPVGLSAGEHQFYCAVTCDGYTLNSDPVTVTVGKKALTATITGITTKTYDGNTTTNNDLAITLEGVVSGDEGKVSATASGYAYDKAGAGNRTITATGVTLSGGAAGNYTLPETVTTAGKITKSQPSIVFNNYPATATYSGTALENPTEAQLTITGAAYGDVEFGWTRDGAAAKPIDAGTYTLTATIPETNNTAEVSITTDVTISPKTITGTVTITGTAAMNETLTAGISDSGQTVSYQWYRGDDPIDGATGSSYTLTAADVGQAIKVTATGTGNYTGTVTSNPTKAVTEAIPKVTAWPTASITYGQALHEITLTGGAAGVEGTFSWVDETVKPTVSDSGTTKYRVTFTPSVAGYTTVTGEITLTVNPAPLTIAANDQKIAYGDSIAQGTDQVTATGLVAGDKLESVTLTASGGKITPSKAVIVNADGSEIVTGNYQVTYTPGTLTYVKRTTSIALKGSFGSFPYTGKPVSNPAPEHLTITGAQYSDVTFAWYALIPGADDPNTTTPEPLSGPPAAAGSYRVVCSLAETDQRTGCKLEIPVTVTPAGDFGKGYSVPIKEKTTGPVTVKLTELSCWPADPGGTPAFKVENCTTNGLDKAEVDANGVLTLTPNGSGSAPSDGSTPTQDTVTVKVTGMGNYQDSTITIRVSYTAKTPITITGVKAADAVYDGNSHAGYTGTPKADGYNGEFSCVYTDTTSSSTSTERPKKAGSYTLEISPADTTDFGGKLTLAFIIEPRPLTWDVSGLTASKPADGNSNPAEVLGELKITGVVGKDVVELDSSTISLTAPDFASSAPHSEKVALTVSGAALTGEDAGNYTLPALGPEITAVINAVTEEALPQAPGQDELKLTVEGGLSTVPDGLKGNPKLDTPAEIETALRTEVTEEMAAANVTVLDVRLQHKVDGKWEDVDPDDFPKNGVTVTLPYPAGTGKTGFTFTVRHLISSGTGVGTIETLDYKLTDAGLECTFMSLSPVAIGYQKNGNSGNPGNPGGGSSSSGYPSPAPGGGSSVVPSAPGYAITVQMPSHGSVSANHVNASQGTTVTLTVTPDSGYALGSLIVSNSQSAALALTDRGGGAYSFTMPSGAVTVTATFKPLPDGAQQPCDGGADCPSHAFADLGGVGTWYHEAVDYVLRNGLMNGYGNGSFGPGEKLSRAQLAQILHNCAGRPAATGANPFLDVANGTWYADAVAWAAENGVVTGYAGYFSPEENVTREQLAVMLWRYAGSPDASAKELYFADADEASAWALEALRWAVENGILTGKDGGLLDPAGEATRAEAATMLMRYLEK